MIENILGYAWNVLIILIPIAILIGVGCATWLIIKFIKSKNIDITDKEIESIQNIVLKVVKYLNQTVVDKLKESSEDGKLTPEQANNVREEALQMIYALLGDDRVQELIDKNETIEGLTEFLYVLIENSVIEAKAESMIAIEAEPIIISE